MGLTNSFICKTKGEIGTDKIRKILLSFPNINPSWLIVIDAPHEESVKNEWYASESYTRKNWELKCSQKHTLDIYSITVRKVLEKNPNEISESSVIFSAMLAKERFRHAEHLLAYISSDILLLLSVWL